MSADQVISEVSAGYSAGRRIPWWGKLGIKLVLARLPVSHALWDRIGLFRHGDIHRNFGRVYEGFVKHINAGAETMERMPETVLELGPGESVGRAVTAAAVGVKKTWLVDVGDFATRDEDYYRGLFDYVREHQPGFSGVPKDFSRDSVLDFCHAAYRTNGLEGLKEIPDGTVEFALSDAVLEHVRRGEFADTMKELYRATAPGGVHRHWVDLHDHLGGRLNNLRFSRKFWESGMVANSGFYTNRLSITEIVDMARDAGFEVNVPAISKWPAVPTPRAKMHQEFRGRSDDELRVCTFLIVMRKKP